jgi:hypothetical protein
VTNPTTQGAVRAIPDRDGHSSATWGRELQLAVNFAADLLQIAHSGIFDAMSDCISWRLKACPIGGCDPHSRSIAVT